MLPGIHLRELMAVFVATCVKQPLIDSLNLTQIALYSCCVPKLVVWASILQLLTLSLYMIVTGILKMIFRYVGTLFLFSFVFLHKMDCFKSVDCRQSNFNCMNYRTLSKSYILLIVLILLIQSSSLT